MLIAISASLSSSLMVLERPMSSDSVNLIEEMNTLSELRDFCFLTIFEIDARDFSLRGHFVKFK